MLICGDITQASTRTRRLFTAEAWVRSQASPCELCGGNSNTVAGLLFCNNMNHFYGKTFAKQYAREQKCVVETTHTVLVSPCECPCVRCVLFCEGGSAVW
jgi:hypothetical protein